ncbi:hypothetical protein [Actinacidiphila reveromycinica]|uniref:hypothetical protein n=1 Tax=Actinacidiphila reveromycinica TaxID=659352 RepID=UPI001921E112|nr:hypothetical protein [Streptomyces sp. SN-593]
MRTQVLVAPLLHVGEQLLCRRRVLVRCILQSDSLCGAEVVDATRPLILRYGDEGTRAELKRLVKRNVHTEAETGSITRKQ